MQKSIPCIYDGQLSSCTAIEEYNAFKVILTAKLDSDLNWENPQKEAQAIADGEFNILWDIDLGLFTELPLPLSDTTQYRSLHLALDHFFESLWKQFELNTLGGILFKGSLDLTSKWNWDGDQILNLRNELTSYFKDAHALSNQMGAPLKELLEIEPSDLLKSPFGENFLRFFCLNSALDYLEILAARFPESLLPYVLLDAKEIPSILHCAQLLDHESFDFIQLSLKNSPIHLPHVIGWESSGYPNGFIGSHPYSLQEVEALSPYGVVIPQKKIYDAKKLAHYDESLSWVLDRERLRFISERNLTIDWSGLDTLFVFEVQELTKRKLEGFIAAGGTVVSLNQNLGLSEEVPFSLFKKKLEVS
jgi:hypothetical protein